MSMAESIKYPDVEVQLSGEGGNAFGIIGRVAYAIRRQIGNDEAQAFTDEAWSSSTYDEVLRLCMKTVTVN